MKIVVECSRPPVPHQNFHTNFQSVDSIQLLLLTITNKIFALIAIPTYWHRTPSTGLEKLQDSGKCVTNSYPFYAFLKVIIEDENTN